MPAVDRTVPMGTNKWASLFQRGRREKQDDKLAESVKVRIRGWEKGQLFFFFFLIQNHPVVLYTFVPSARPSCDHSLCAFLALMTKDLRKKTKHVVLVLVNHWENSFLVSWSHTSSFSWCHEWPFRKLVIAQEDEMDCSTTWEALPQIELLWMQT